MPRKQRKRTRIIRKPTEEQRVEWVRGMLAHFGLKGRGILPLFEIILRLQSGPRTGPGGVDEKSIAMVRLGADPDGAFTQQQHSQYDTDPRTEQIVHQVTVYLPRLAEALLELHPPWLVKPILLERGDKCCKLINLSSTPRATVEKDQRFKNWRCFIDGKTATTGPIHLPFPPERRIRATLVNIGAWKPPKYFPEYSSFNEMRWKEHFDKDPNAYNGPTLFFSGVKYVKGATRIEAKEGLYSNYIATIQSFSRLLVLPDGTSRLVSDVLGMGWDSQSNLLPLPVASPVAANVMLVTKEGSMLVSSNRNGYWDVPLSAIPHLVSDGYKGKVAEIYNQSLRRRAYDELGLQINPERISWIAFGVGRKYGHTGLMGQIQLPVTQDDILRFFENRKEHEREKPAFVSLEIDAVNRFLRTQKCRYFLRLGMHLCLWRKFPKRVEILA